VIGVRTIRFRLTAAYAIILTVLVGGTAVWSWVAARHSVSVTVDRSLERDMTLFQSNVQMTSRRMDIVQAIQMSTTWGVRDLLVRVFDANGTMVYQSPSLAHQLRTGPPDVESGRITFRTVSGSQDEDVRLAATAIDIHDHRYVVELVQPVTMGERSLARFGRMLMLVIPLALVLATLGGYWLSGRALAPVAQITNDARRINATNLADRLAVPPAHDELRELSQTLNAMLGRIDRSVSQLRQFTADASHELRAPLALIYTAAEFSLRRERPREDLVEALEKILRESRHTTSLVDSLLLLARADSGEDNLQAPVAINVSSLCQDAADRAAELASAKGITVSTDLRSTSIVVDGDETALRRLLLILADNAVKYTPAGGRVNVRLALEKDAALIRISDTGIGIAAADLPHVFDRFWRADKVRSRATGGTGLGLAIARWIVDRHGGTIVVSSELGKGSTFTVTLPLAPESRPAADNSGRLSLS
jgi:two-component system, OmpR family, heavy metal sensor histidine kinase CusS